MRAAKVFCAVALLCGSVLGATPGLLVTPDGYYAVSVDASGKPVTEKITNVMVLGAAPVPPTGGGGGGTTPTGLAAAVEAMSKQKVPNADEGTALAAAMQLLTKSITTDQGIEEAMDRTIAVGGRGLNAKTRIDAWYAALKALPGFTFTQAGLKETLAGLQKAYGVDGATLGGLVDTTLSGVQAGQSVEQINDTLGAANPNAAFDFTMILTILMAIIDVLKQLGVIM